MSGRDCAGEVKKLGREGFSCSGNTNIGNERKHLLWFKSSGCREAKIRDFLVLPDVN